MSTRPAASRSVSRGRIGLLCTGILVLTASCGDSPSGNAAVSSAGSEEESPEVVTPADSFADVAPNDDAELSVEPVPAGWTQVEVVRDRNPSPADDQAYTILLTFEGPSTYQETPGGSGNMPLTVTVSASFSRGTADQVASDGLASFLPSDAMVADSTLDFNGFDAITATTQVGPYDAHHISFDSGDWLFLVTGVSVDVDTLEAFAEGVVLA